MAGAIRDYIAYVLVIYGPLKITSNCNTRFGRWCVENAGSWAYRAERRDPARPSTGEK